MNRMRMTWWTLAALLLAALLAGCSSGDSGGSIVGASTGLLEDDGPVVLTADPDEVIIDLNDPSTPTDPDSNEAYGTSALTVMVMDEMGSPVEGAEVVFTTTAGTLESEGAPIMTDAEGKAGDVLQLLESDPDSVDVTATVGEDSATTTVTKTVIPLNNPPVADAGEDQTVECGQPAILDGSGSTDPDSTEGTNDDIALFEWYLGREKLGEGEMIRWKLPVGTNTVTLKVTDSGGLTDTDETTVEVEDTLPPRVAVTLDPSEIWPPNHKMVDVWASVRIADQCYTNPDDMSVVLMSVTSNEPDNGLGDGNHEPDILGADVGTEDYSFQLRAERSGGGSGRIYTATYKVIDPAGNETDASGEAVVPHDQGH
jgi:hypothetical protein